MKCYLSFSPSGLKHLLKMCINSKRSALYHNASCILIDATVNQIKKEYVNVKMPFYPKSRIKKLIENYEKL